MWKELTVIFIGGGVGSLLRYGVQLAMRDSRTFSGPFPWSTLVVNILGSFLIGLFYALSAHFRWPAELRLLLTTGLCGGFTTFSTFSHDGLLLLKQGNTAAFLLYASLSFILGLVAVFIGSSCHRWF